MIVGIIYVLTILGYYFNLPYQYQYNINTNDDLLVSRSIKLKLLPNIELVAKLLMRVKRHMIHPFAM